MKINYNNTALGLLTKMNEYSFRLVDDGGVTSRIEKTNLGLSLVREWHKMSGDFASKKRYICKSFYDAYEKALPKLAKILDAEPMHESGTLIFAPNAGETNTIFYNLSITGKQENFRIEGIVLAFTSQKDKDKPALTMLVHRLIDGSVKEYISKKSKGSWHN